MPSKMTTSHRTIVLIYHYSAMSFSPLPACVGEGLGVRGHMSKRYTPEEKTAALAALEENRGDTAITSLKTGIPQRTLQAWRRAAIPPEELLRRLSEKNTAQQAPPPQQLMLPRSLMEDDPAFAEILRHEGEHADALLDEVLKQLMESVRVLAGRLTTNFDNAPPVSQMMALTRLIDRVLKLDARQPRVQKPKAYIMRYQYPDRTFHKVPPWYHGAESDADKPGFTPFGWKDSDATPEEWDAKEREYHRQWNEDVFGVSEPEDDDDPGDGHEARLNYLRSIGRLPPADQQPMGEE